MKLWSGGERKPLPAVADVVGLQKPEESWRSGGEPEETAELSVSPSSGQSSGDLWSPCQKFWDELKNGVGNNDELQTE